MKKPLIFITNDDGVRAKGIAELIEIARPFGELLVIAPDGLRSGNSNALTMEVPVIYKLLRQEPGLTIYECTGTPTDCAKLAFYIGDRQPDFIFSGINHGSNAAINVIYSGTMGAVFEGCVRGVPSVGFSLCDHKDDADFSLCKPIFEQIIQRVLRDGLPHSVCLNVNAPTGQPRGVRVCRQADGYWEEEFALGKSPAGKDYGWMTGYFVNREPEKQDTDISAIDAGFVSVVPTCVDMTAHAVLRQMSDYEAIG